MNEEQATALFAPARERPLPPAAFAIADVFAADLRHRRRTRAAAVSATVLVVVLAVVGFFALSGTKTPRPVTPAVTPTTTTQSLASMIDAVVVPPNSTSVATDPTGRNTSYGSGPGYQQIDRYWTAQSTPLEAITAMTAHPPAGLVSPYRPTVETVGGTIDQHEQLDAPETATTDGPHLFLDAQAMPSGLTALAVHVWETVKPAKTADDVITGAVSSVSAKIATGGNDLAGVAPLTGEAAQRLTDDVNGLWVKLAPEGAGCGATLSSSTTFVLTFHTAAGEKSFFTGCDSVFANNDPTATPLLWKSRALVDDLQADYGRLLPAPLQKLDYLQGPQPAFAASPANLTTILDHLTPPANAQQIPAPADLQDGKYGYADQPGYQQAIRAWTTTLDPDAAIAALTKQPPSGMTGGLPPPEPGGKGPPEATATYKATDTATRIGPQLELDATEKTPGITTIEALAWQLDKTAKPVRDTVTGTVLSVSGSWADGQIISAPKDLSQRLADDVNSLLVNNSAFPKGCSQATPALTLTFRTSTGDEQFADSCGLVQVVPMEGAFPELQTSDALNLDVNQAFGSLLLTPLPTSAPLPTSTAGPGRRADQLLTNAPATVSIETIQPVGKGKQRMTDQTFDVTGARADNLLADLKAMQVYNGNPPAGCQPDARVAMIDVTQAGKHLQYQSSCEQVTMPPFTNGLTLSPAAVDNDLTADFAELTPVRSVDPPLDGSLQLDVVTPSTNAAGTAQKSVAGTITVTQDGITIGTKHLAMYDQWTLPVRQGTYTISAIAPGYSCGPPQVISVYGDEQTGTAPSCTKG